MTKGKDLENQKSHSPQFKGSKRYPFRVESAAAVLEDFVPVFSFPFC